MLLMTCVLRRSSVGKVHVLRGACEDLRIVLSRDYADVLMRYPIFSHVARPNATLNDFFPQVEKASCVICFRIVFEGFRRSGFESRAIKSRRCMHVLMGRAYQLRYFPPPYAINQPSLPVMPQPCARSLNQRHIGRTYNNSWSTDMRGYLLSAFAYIEQLRYI